MQLKRPRASTSEQRWSRATNPVLVVGASGLVGRYLAMELDRTGHSVVSASRMPDSGESGLTLDLTDGDAVKEAIQAVDPEVVYLPAAQANVDACEMDPLSSFAVNVTGTRSVCAAANSVGARIAFFSTDYVFDGTGGPYREQDEPNPLNEYGKQKLAAERVVLGSGGLVIRTSTVFGWRRDGHPSMQSLLDQLAKGRTVEVAGDQICTPTYAPDLARAAIRLVKDGIGGVLHVAGSLTVGRATFASHAAHSFGFDPSLVLGVPAESLGYPARRPERGGLHSTKAERIVGFEFRDCVSGLDALAVNQHG